MVFIANVTFDWTAEYYVDSHFNEPVADLVISSLDIAVISPFVDSLLLLVPVENHGQVTAYDSQVKIFLNPYNANAANYSTLANITQYVP